MSVLFQGTTTEIVDLNDISALENNAENTNPEFCSIYDLFCSIAAANPNAPALTFLPSGSLDADPLRLNRGELLEHIRQAANMFHDLGVGSADVVSFLLPNLLEAQFTLWGAQTAGIVNPINYLLGTDQIVEICNTARTKILVALGPHPTLDIWQKVEVLKDRVKTLKNVLIVGGVPKSAGDFLSFQETIKSFPTERLIFDRSVAADDVASLFHTGGTTRTPKLAPLTQRNELVAARSTAQMFAFGERDVLVNGLPLFHVAAPILLTLAPLGAGSEVLIPSPAGLRDPLVLENHWQLLQKYGVTIAGGVPTSLADLACVPLRDADISAVEFAVTGGATLSTGVAKNFQKQTGLAIHQIYGMTETAGVIAVAPRGRTPVDGSVGLRAPGVHVKAVHLDHNGKWAADCKAGESGVLAVKGNNVFPGYLNRSQVNDTFLANEWLNTGDIGHVDNEGWIFVTGRAKDVIIRSGHNIDPALIEEVADGHPAVDSSVAVGQPDARAGEVPVVFVTVIAGTAADPMEIRQYIRDNMPEKPAKPVAVYIVPSIPLTAVGKVYRPKLRCEAIKRLIERELEDVDCVGTTLTVSVTENTTAGITTTIRVHGKEANKQSIRKIIDERLSRHSYSYTLA